MFKENTMKKLVSIALLMSISYCMYAQSDNILKEKTILQLHEVKFEWLVKKQYDSLKLVLDENLIYIHSNGWTESKADIIADLKSGKLNYLGVKVTESKARIFKATAIVTGKGFFKVVMEGKPVELELMYTEVYQEKKKGWKLVSRHANKI
jgi:predicted HAD superfamily phosphohydrolase YqeG